MSSETREKLIRRLRYDLDPSAVSSEVRDKFVEVELGDEGDEYIEAALERRAGRARTRVHRMLLSYMSDFDANGAMNMYPMHLLGTSQWRRLVGESAGRRHLDVGAGSGDVTATLAPLSTEIVTTETSWMMSRRLRQRGFQCVRADVAEGEVPNPEYDLITCLNVIDRCKKPRSLLQNLRDGLKPGGTLVVATPLPYDAFFYDGPQSLDPAERLGLEKDSWESSVTKLIHDVLEPLGLEVVSVSRAPYLSGGDASKPFYVLDDAILVLRRRD